ncbi:MAG: hypothetical protein H8D96_11530 [Desulfobacterales bacterium]|uniref:Uncharacterized protein n=1 Tax=Candidatus Desulfatibia vada TaxID=2841696 RepID=A0A8J6NUC2_9BACT|nr:hypothetical protein [Candidatus Desulfatibia vada]
MLQIEDVASAYWGEEPIRRLLERRKEYIEWGGDKKSIRECYILDNWDEIRAVTDEFLSVSKKNVIIDISTLPKRFFFSIMRRLLETSTSDTIIATYTRPEKYDTSRPLAIDPEPWRALSGFQEAYPEPKRKMLIVGLGYEPLGLPQILKEGNFAGESIRLLFPFPATPAGYLRNWEFVRNLDSEVGPYQHDPVRVNGYDLSGIFDYIRAITDHGREYAVFAPYGTKPMSLAMCLYAIYNTEKAAVYYTQPLSYNPRYSTGIKMVDGIPETYAYCLRLNRRNLYTLD